MSANGHGEPDLHAVDHAIDRALALKKPDGGPLVEATLRDFFAGKAPVMPRTAFRELPRSPVDSDGQWMARRYAAWAFTFADAMLTERDKRAEPTP